MVEWTVEIGPGAGTAYDFAFFTCKGVGETPQEALDRARAQVKRRMDYLAELEADAVRIGVEIDNGR